METVLIIGLNGTSEAARKYVKSMYKNAGRKQELFGLWEFDTYMEAKRYADSSDVSPDVKYAFVGGGTKEDVMRVAREIKSDSVVKVYTTLPLPNLSSSERMMVDGFVDLTDTEWDNDFAQSLRGYGPKELEESPMVRASPIQSETGYSSARPSRQIRDPTPSRLPESVAPLEIDSDRARRVASERGLF